jgi:F0F1-type ATP synthase assembly protein I
MNPSNGGGTLMAAPEKPNRLSAQKGLTVLGSEMVGFAALGVLIDYALGTLHTIPWATLILTPLGSVVALWHLIRTVRQSPKP